MANLNSDQKAKLYNDMLYRYQRLQEQVRLIKAENFEVSEKDQRTIYQIENQMKKIFSDTQKLYL